MVRLKSKEGEVFEVPWKRACYSTTIANMLEAGSEEGATLEVDLSQITSVVLAKVIEYFEFKERYSKTTGTIPEFPLTEDIVVDTLMAANFLGC